MAYWLCITNEANWNVIKNICGVPERHKNTIAKVKPGDKLVIYLKQENVKSEVKPSRIVAVYSEPFRDSTRIFSSEGLKTFPYKIKAKPVKIFDKPIEFKLIPKLKFITNKKK